MQWLISYCWYGNAAERDYDMQFWKEELIREINELEKSASGLEVSSRITCIVINKLNIN